VIPLLDANRHLTGVVSRDHLPIRAEEPYMLVPGLLFGSALAEVARISRIILRMMAGRHQHDYFFVHHATLRVRDDEKVIVRRLI